MTNLKEIDMNARNVLALALVLLGIGFLLDSFEYMEFSQAISDWWPLLIILLGIAHISRKNPPVFSGLLIISVGVLLLADRLGYLSGGFWSAFWPLIIVIIGLSMLFPVKKYFSKHSHTQNDGALNLTTLFGGQSRKIEDKNFIGGNISATFGGIEIDLTDAELSPEGATLYVNTTFGGLELSVPRHWKIVYSGSPVFGGFDDKTRQNQSDEDTRILSINYNVIFGGIEVNNKLR
jgi:predicted membrane protein